MLSRGSKATRFELDDIASRRAKMVDMARVRGRLLRGSRAADQRHPKRLRSRRCPCVDRRNGVEAGWWEVQQWCGDRGDEFCVWADGPEFGNDYGVGAG